MSTIPCAACGFINGALVGWLANQGGYHGWASAGFAALSTAIVGIGYVIAVIL